MDRSGAVRFFLSLCSIILIDLLLAGDNALVIAMAVRSLPKDQRRIGSVCGAGAAVVLRVALTFVAARLLSIQFLKLAGGLFVLWIAVKVLVDASGSPEANPSPRRFSRPSGTSCSRTSPCPPITFWPSPAPRRAASA